MKQYKLHTLIDITETHARRGEDPTAYKQQQNWMALIQTIGLHCNPIVVHQETEKQSIASMGFGTTYKGKQQVWTVIFDFEHAADDDIEVLNKIFDLVPVATELDETVPIKNSIFQTQDSSLRNIVFEFVR
jgi:hypothetical protein